MSGPLLTPTIVGGPPARRRRWNRAFARFPVTLCRCQRHNVTGIPIGSARAGRGPAGGYVSSGHARPPTPHVSVGDGAAPVRPSAPAHLRAPVSGAGEGLLGRRRRVRG